MILTACTAAVSACGPRVVGAQQKSQEKEQILWQKLEATVNEVDGQLDGVLAVAILDLSTGQKYLLHADEVMPTASSIKIAILAELYRQAQQGKADGFLHAAAGGHGGRKRNHECAHARNDQADSEGRCGADVSPHDTGNP
jgi:hypothetical protein